MEHKYKTEKIKNDRSTTIDMLIHKSNRLEHRCDNLFLVNIGTIMCLVVTWFAMAGIIH